MKLLFAVHCPQMFLDRALFSQIRNVPTSFPCCFVPSLPFRLTPLLSAPDRRFGFLISQPKAEGMDGDDVDTVTPEAWQADVNNLY